MMIPPMNYMACGFNKLERLESAESEDSIEAPRGLRDQCGLFMGVI